MRRLTILLLVVTALSSWLVACSSPFETCQGLQLWVRKLAESPGRVIGAALLTGCGEPLAGVTVKGTLLRTGQSSETQTDRRGWFQVDHALGDRVHVMLRDRVQFEFTVEGVTHQKCFRAIREGNVDWPEVRCPQGVPRTAAATGACLGACPSAGSASLALDHPRGGDWALPPTLDEPRQL